MTYETLIRRLAEHWGMSWSAIHTACGLPVSRIRNWARFGDDDIPNEAITKLQLLDRWMTEAEEAGSPEPAYELDRRLVDGYTATGWDLYRNGEDAALLRIVAGADATEVLDDTFVDWRTRFDTAFEVFDDDESEKYIRVKPGRAVPRSS